MFELTQKEMVAYIVYSSKKINIYTEKTIDNYIDKLQNDLLNIKIGQVLYEIDLKLFNYFDFNAKLNHSEIIAYSKLIYQRLLNQADRQFTDEDIIEKSKYVFNNYSVRTAAEEVISEKL